MASGAKLSKTARASLGYDYFRRQFEEEGHKRKELMDLFDKALTQ